MFYAIKDLGYLLLAGARIFSRLGGSPGVKMVCASDT
jgi:hypothetical protein